MSFLDVQIIREDKTFTTSVSRKPTLNGVYTHFDNFLLSTYKFTLHNELVCLKEIFLKNDWRFYK